MKGYFSVKNFDKYQHYKGVASIVWIKLYVALLEDYEFTLLPDSAKWHLIGIFLLSGKLNNRVPAEHAWVARRISATETVDLTLLAKAGFIVLESTIQDLVDGHRPVHENGSIAISENGSRAISENGSMPEEKRGEERRGEEKRKKDSCTEVPAGPSAPAPSEAAIPDPGGQEKPPPAPKPPAVIEPAWIEMPTQKFDTIGETVGIPWSKIETWSASYPGVDVGAELKKMRAWLMEAGPRRKTKGGMGQFVVNWLNRAQNQSSGGMKIYDPKGLGSAKNRRFLNGLARAQEHFEGIGEARPGEGEGGDLVAGETGGPPAIRSLG